MADPCGWRKELFDDDAADGMPVIVGRDAGEIGKAQIFISMLRTPTCRSCATIAYGLYLFLAISILHH
jgi:hypothetical protein